MDLKTLQDEVRDWSHANFGDGFPLRPLLGVIEEVGELCAAVPVGEEVTPAATTCVVDLLYAQELLGLLAHAVLKGIQGIRGGDLGRVERLAPWVSKVVSALMGLLEAAGIEGDAGASQMEAVADAVGDIEIYLADFCRKNGLSLDWVVGTTWAKVKQRDWRRDPQAGGGG